MTSPQGHISSIPIIITLDLLKVVRFSFPVRQCTKESVGLYEMPKLIEVFIFLAKSGADIFMFVVRVCWFIKLNWLLSLLLPVTD